MRPIVKSYFYETTLTLCESRKYFLIIFYIYNFIINYDRRINCLCYRLSALFDRSLETRGKIVCNSQFYLLRKMYHVRVYVNHKTIPSILGVLRSRINYIMLFFFFYAYCNLEVASRFVKHNAVVVHYNRTIILYLLPS